MMNNLNKEYTNNLLLKIKNYIDIFNADFSNNSKIVYNANFTYPTKSVKAVQIIGTIWGIIILVVISVLIYSELILPAKINISISSFVIISFIFIILLITLIVINIRHIKRVKTIILNNEMLKLEIYKFGQDMTHTYYLKDISLKIKKRKTNHNINGKTFEIFINCNKSKNRYLIKTNYEEEFFAFIFYLSSLYKHFNLNNISDGEINKMYHTYRKNWTINYK